MKMKKSKIISTSTSPTKVVISSPQKAVANRHRSLILRGNE